jgi:hypothetical protein
MNPNLIRLTEPTMSINLELSQDGGVRHHYEDIPRLMIEEALDGGPRSQYLLTRPTLLQVEYSTYGKKQVRRSTYRFPNAARAYPLGGPQRSRFLLKSPCPSAASPLCPVSRPSWVSTRSSYQGNAPLCLSWKHLNAFCISSLGTFFHILSGMAAHSLSITLIRHPSKHELTDGFFEIMRGPGLQMSLRVAGPNDETAQTVSRYQK